ncbi:hypothetical protein LWF15_00580 [Kineosporia rhizophila]|uniref:hypothetical protein n=1 Tax=Kineosporia TaxID=49184 RepID=UPI000B3408BD|nr:MULTISPECIES: hypothetical protein [Kineosporia]MCE0534000.1 hypothetical protein [Kineosporia rhizophila]GLY13540.1 hypothetical protein Kisp01_05560 [Kineosporia sp. NBRC 101677]
MNDHEIDRLLGQIEFDGGPRLEDRLRGAGQELLEEIMNELPRNSFDDQPVRPVPLPERSQARRWRAAVSRPLVGVAAAAAVVAAIVIPAMAFERDQEEPVVTTPAASEAPVPTPTVDPSFLKRTTNPWIVVDAPGWEIDHISEEDWGEGVYGELEYLKGKAEIQLFWSSDDEYQNDRQKRIEEYGQPQVATLLGSEAELFRTGQKEYEVLARLGRTYLKIRGSGSADPAVFQKWLGGLEQVEPGEWYAAQPESVVVPYRSKAAAERVLQDVPVPAGFDRSTLTSNLTASYDVFGARVTGKVTCAWLDQYSAAREKGDEATMKQVDQALGSATDWRFLKSMDPEDGWDEAILSYAAAVADRQPITGAAQGLGCHD